MEDSIYDSDIEFHVFKYKTKKGRRYLSKKFEQKTISTTVTVVDIDDAQSNVYLLKRMASSAGLNPNALNTEYKIKITKFTLGKKVGVKSRPKLKMESDYRDVEKLYGILNEPNILDERNFEDDLKIGEENEMVVSRFLESKGMRYISSCTYKEYDLLMCDKDNNEVKFEVKTDVLVTKDNDTGNIVIEIRYKGNPSGISSTEAKWFVYYYANLDKENLWMIKVDDLKKLIKDNKFKIVMGGDNNDSELVLIKRYDYISKFKVYNLCQKENTKGKNL